MPSENLRCDDTGDIFGSIAPQRVFDRCICCGRGLSDPISMTLGVGPVCRVKQKMVMYKQASDNMSGRRSDYSLEVVGHVICIVDQDTGMSVTNDVDNVVGDLLDRFGNLDRFRIIYRDTMGTWDEIVIRRNLFQAFRSVNEREQSAAVRKVSTIPTDAPVM